MQESKMSAQECLDYFEENDNYKIPHWNPPQTLFQQLKQKTYEIFFIIKRMLK